VFKRKSEILAAHCEDVGTEYDAIVRSASYNVVIGETENDVADKLAWVRTHWAPHVPADRMDGQIANLQNSPLAGTPEQLVERLTEARALGMTYAITYFPEIAYDRSGFNLFTEKVIPALADA
jgi:alkanesulfonate monooxygenase SsuD/methylene tetrahydromethanopterin reductase-like flavin-dependent oxidoreductase (luciferase family)